MRAVSWVFALIGGCALTVAVVGNLIDGDPAGAGWVLIGPAPIYAVGLAGAFDAGRCDRVDDVEPRG